MPTLVGMALDAEPESHPAPRAESHVRLLRPAAGRHQTLALAIVAVVAVVAIVLSRAGVHPLAGIDPRPRLDPFPAAPTAARSSAPTAAPSVDPVEFVGAVVADVQDTWTNLFSAAGLRYQPTQLVLFRGTTRSACGPATLETGPFYCPLDDRVYLDLDFFTELRTRLGSPGDFAQAYVIAHEFGHHVQNLLGISGQVAQAEQAQPGAANELSVRTELQADCLAGVWAHSAYQKSELEAGDLQEGIAAAAAVGDDRLQRQATGVINPEQWTHGSSQQRVSWFLAGYGSGEPKTCDTFSNDSPP
jgi:predicted metalloprotease